MSIWKIDLPQFELILLKTELKVYKKRLEEYNQKNPIPDLNHIGPIEDAIEALTKKINEHRLKNLLINED